MAEPDFKAAARDIEEHLGVPDFDQVARRGHAIRTRRRATRAGAAAAGAVVVVAGAVAALGLTASGPDGDPAAPPADDAAVALLRDPAATVDGTATTLSDSGALLHRVVVPSPAGNGCDADLRTALVLVAPGGEIEARQEDVVGRAFAEVPGGFVVGAPDPACRAVLPDAGGGAYLVTPDGERREVTWAEGAEEVCAVDVGSPRCEVDVDTAVGRLLAADERLVPNRSAQPVAQDGSDLWARSVDATTLHWSADGGRTWESHQTTLDGPNLQVDAAGDRAVFVDWPVAEVTTDQGRTWRQIELDEAPDRFTVPDLDVVVTPSGGLVLVSRPVGGPPLVLAATDDSWEQLTPVDLRTQVGGVHVERSGDWLFVPDLESGWRSADGGLTWELVDPLA